MIIIDMSKMVKFVLIVYMRLFFVLRVKKKIFKVKIIIVKLLVVFKFIRMLLDVVLRFGNLWKVLNRSELLMVIVIIRIIRIIVIVVFMLLFGGFLFGVVGL